MMRVEVRSESLASWGQPVKSPSGYEQTSSEIVCSVRFPLDTRHCQSKNAGPITALFHCPLTLAGTRPVETVILSRAYMLR